MRRDDGPSPCEVADRLRDPVHTVSTIAHRAPERLGVTSQAGLTARMAAHDREVPGDGLTTVGQRSRIPTGEIDMPQQSSIRLRLRPAATWQMKKMLGRRDSKFGAFIACSRRAKGILRNNLRTTRNPAGTSWVADAEGPTP